MSSTPINVVPDGDRWGVLRQGDDQFIDTYDTREEAEARGREIAEAEQAPFAVVDEV